MIIVKNISKFYGSHKVISGATLHVSPGEKTGIVGSNGSGKSTLLKIIAGRCQVDDGTVSIERGVKIGFLPQQIQINDDCHLMEYLIKKTEGYSNIENERKQILAKLESGLTGKEEKMLIEKLAAIEEQFRLEEGHSFVARAKKVLTGLGFRDSDEKVKVSLLSGGWKMRLELARLLLESPSVLCLDEPTNHLDIQSMQWLEQYIRNSPSTVIVVSHDREFLNRTVSKIIEVSENGRVREFTGGYDAYRNQKEIEIKEAWRKYNRQQARIKEIEEFIARNRVRKDRAKVVQARIKMLEKMERIEPPREKKIPSVMFPQPPYTPSPLVKCQQVSVKFDSTPALNNLTLSILRGEKVAIIGPNGSGKTTLLKTLAGIIKPSSGTVQIAQGVFAFYYSQHQISELNDELTVIEEMMGEGQNKTIQQIRNVLGGFLFSTREEVNKKVGDLSGGEKARLALAKMLLNPAPLLLLDEPTNHLDIESRIALENGLKQFEGCVVFASHDRRLIKNIATRIVELADGRFINWQGDYEFYQWKKSKQMVKTVPSTTEKKEDAGRDVNTTRKKKGKKKERKEKRRIEAEKRLKFRQLTGPIEEEMKRLENEIEEKEKMMADIEKMLLDEKIYKNGEKLKELGEKRKSLLENIKQLYNLWEEAGGNLERIVKEWENK